MVTGTKILHEKPAPDGYTVAGDETFRFDENGEVTYSGTMTEDSVLLLKDEKVTKESRVTIDNTGTGDNSHAALWTAILLMAFAALLLSVKRVK